MSHLVVLDSFNGIGMCDDLGILATQCEAFPIKIMWNLAQSQLIHELIAEMSVLLSIFDTLTEMILETLILSPIITLAISHNLPHYAVVAHRSLVASTWWPHMTKP
eukprot:gene1790-1954_t